jgi:hypothetical protein
LRYVRLSTLTEESVRRGYVRLSSLTWEPVRLESLTYFKEPRMFRHLGIACCLSVVLCLGSAGLPLYAQPAADKTAAIEKVLVDWKHRLDRCKSVRYVVSGKTEKKDLPKGSKAPAVRPVKYVVLLDLVRGRVRVEHECSEFSASGDRYVPSGSVHAFDGRAYQRNADRERCELAPQNPDIVILKGPADTCTLDNELLPLLCAHGIVPTVNKPPRLDRLPKRHTAEEFDSRGDVNHAGSRCLLLRTDPAASQPSLVDEFWIDPAKESAVVRHVYFSGKNPFFRFDTVYQNSTHGWVPASWTFAFTAGHLVEVSRFTVESVEIDPVVMDADFALPIPAGSIVIVQTYPEAGKGLDPNKPASGTFRVDPAGKWLPLEEETGFTTGDGVQLAPESPNRRWLWWGSAALVGAFVATVVGLYRRRMRRITKS